MEENNASSPGGLMKKSSVELCAPDSYRDSLSSVLVRNLLLHRDPQSHTEKGNVEVFFL